MSNTSKIKKKLDASQRGIQSELLHKFDDINSDLKKTSNMGPTSHIMKQPAITKDRNRSLSRVKLEELRAKRDISRKRTELPEGFYSTRRRDDMAHVDPKIYVHRDNNPGQPPRDVVIQRTKKQFTNFDVEEELTKLGITFKEPFQHPGDRIPLEHFDDGEYDSRTPQDWLEFCAQDGVVKGILAKALKFNPDGTAKWMQCLVDDQDQKTDRWYLKWRDENKTPDTLHKLQVCFSVDDQRKQAERIKKALESRRECANILAYNQQIDKMPVTNLPTLPDWQKNKIMELLKTKNMSDPYVNPMAVKALDHLRTDYARTQNKMIFDKQMPEAGEKVLKKKLSIPDKQKSTEIKKQGLIKIPIKKKRFLERLEKFTFQTMQVNFKIVEAFREIHLTRKQAEEMCFMRLDTEYSWRLEEFKIKQETQINWARKQLVTSWTKKIEDAIKTHVREVGKGGFNLDERVRETQNKSKLKKLFILVKQQMQDVIYNLSKNSATKILEQFVNIFPIEVKIEDIRTVENIWRDVDRTNVIDTTFSLEVAEDIELNCFKFSTRLEEFKEVITDIFHQGIKASREVTVVEKTLMNDLFIDKRGSQLKAPHLPSNKPRPITQEEEIAGVLPDQNAWLWDIYQNLTDTLDYSIEAPIKQLALFQEFRSEISLDAKIHFQTKYGKLNDQIKIVKDSNISKMMDKWSTISWDIEEIGRDLALEMQRVAELEKLIPDNIQLGGYYVSCESVKQKQIDKHYKIALSIQNMVQSLIKWCNNEIRKFKERLVYRLSFNPQDIRALFELKSFLDEVPSHITEMQRMIESVDLCQELLQVYHQPIENSVYLDKFNTLKYSKQVWELREAKDSNLNTLKDHQLDLMRQDQQMYSFELEVIKDKIETVSKQQDVSKSDDYLYNVLDLDKQINNAQNKAMDFNEQENQQNLPITLQDIKSLVRKFENQKNLWTTISAWKSNQIIWMDGLWEKLNGDLVDKEVYNYKGALSKSRRYYRDDTRYEQLLNSLDEFINEITIFQQQLPIAVALSVEGMKDRHWKELSKEVGKEINPKVHHLTMRKLCDMDIQSHMTAIEEISNRAQREQGIRNDLDKMQREWETMRFQFTTLKNTSDVQIVKNFEDFLNVCDEHTGLTTALQYSPQKEFFDDEISKWKQSLEVVSELFVNWMKLQIQYMQLQPVFSSGDIKKSLQQYQKMFQQVDNRWKINLESAQRSEVVLDFVNNEMLRDSISEDIVVLDKVQKNLENQLTIKRCNFARLQFLSDDELLKILSNTQEPRNINDQLKKIFECMDKLVFNEESRVTHFTSKEGEIIALDTPVNPKDLSVEIWCKHIESAMVETMKSKINLAIKDYKKRSRKEWVKYWYSQCVLSSTQLFFTIETENAIEKHMLQEYHQKCDMQIIELVELVRTPLSSLEKKTISPLIVQGVHEKDIVDRLLKNGIRDIGEFEWVCQLRFQLLNNELWSRCMQTEQPQGQEQMGNADRLVITPLTDKCYMTLMGALKLNLGGSPNGPAGTGKTESTKDLSKNLAKQCKVFNCGPEMEQLMIGTFFKGLASCGAWCCFDEFNRITLDVLSVVAQQLQTLFGEKAKDSGSAVQFLETEIQIQKTFSVFITQNPTQKGRQQLPDNLKALFRPVAMMVPDSILISEIFLYSFGFVESRMLAGKMVDVFTLCSEQLSQQTHQDYGLRAVRSTINNAGAIKRREPEANESSIVLKALIDINLPKFLQQDIPLFNNIISDLFPSTQILRYKQDELKTCIDNELASKNLCRSDNIEEKIFQLQETTLMRHGIMIVGSTGAGKSVAYQTLLEAINQLVKVRRKNKDWKSTEVEEVFNTIVSRRLNPKAILTEQVQGQLNPITKEYSRGLVPVLFNRAVEEKDSRNRQWIMFDGPVDPLWIESMNSCLDDSKKLCLPNSEIIDMTDFFTLFFETDSLDDASLATISRCGMVQLDPKELTAQHIWHSQQVKFPETIQSDSKFIPRLKLLQDKLFNETQMRTQKDCKPLIKSSFNNCCVTFFNIITCLTMRAKKSEQGENNQVEVDRVVNAVDLIFTQALVWSVGSNLTDESKHIFHKIVLAQFVEFNNEQMKRDLTDDKSSEDKLVDGSEEDKNADSERINSTCILKSDQSQFNLCIDFTKSKFKHVSALHSPQVFKNISQEEIVVPTEDSYKMYYISSLLCTNNFHVLNVGQTGTGKSINCDTLLTEFPTNKYHTVTVTFNARTNVTIIHNTLGSKLKRRKAGSLGPENNKKAVYFVDDFNMPKKERFNAQPVLELIRQWFDFGGWQDMADCEFKAVVDILFLTAMGVPGGGRTEISNRLTRHFNILGYSNLSEKSVNQMFSSITEGFYQNNGISEDNRNSIQIITSCSVKSQQKITKKFLPVPKKSHQMFNLRDLSKVFQGLCLATPKTFVSDETMIRLWVHEMSRVFRDRLVEEQDGIDFDTLVGGYINAGQEKETMHNLTKEKILFGDFVDKDQDKTQKEIEDIPKLTRILEEFLDDQNNENTPMHLILFSDCCSHITRLCRVLTFPRGNALLMGIGGSGRQSCAKLANFTMNYKLFQIEITQDYRIEKNWREDTKALLMHAGVKRNPITFLLVDSQILEDKMLEDINNILNTADVPNLQNHEDIEEMNRIARRDCQEKNIELTPINLFNQQLNAVKKNMHLVLAMSQASETFRQNLLNFPSIINCNTIDYYSEWPRDALISVAKDQINKLKIDTEEHTDDLIDIFSQVHKTVETQARLYEEEMRRYQQVTPTSYLELIRVQRSLLQEQSENFIRMTTRYDSGLHILEESHKITLELRKKIKEKEPELQDISQMLTKKNDTLKKMIEHAVTKKDEMDTARVQQNIKVEQLTRLNDEIAEERRETELEKQGAMQQAKNLNPKDITEVSSYTHPPEPICHCMRLIVLLFDEEKSVVNKESLPEWFNVCKNNLLRNVKELKKELINRLEKEKISERQYLKIEPFYDSKKFDDKTQYQNISGACVKLAGCIKAMRLIQLTNQKLEPILERQRDAQDKLTKHQEVLDKLVNEQKEVEDKVSRLQMDEEETKLRKETTQTELELNKVKLLRANKLLSGLSEERERWTLALADLRVQNQYKLGNSVFAAAMIAQAGAFDSMYRSKLMEEWKKQADEKKVPFKQESTLISVIGNKVKIENWKALYSLPSDEFSIENAIIIDQSMKWPLCIDPQSQASVFLKKMGNDKKLDQFKLINSNDEKLAKEMELAVKTGKWILVENLGEKIPTDMESIMTPQIKMRGRSKVIRWEDREIEYNEDFRLFLVNGQQNPHYQPEICVRVCLINFSITELGLREQMLSLTVSLEKKELEEERLRLIENNAKNEKKLEDKENDILETLRQTNPEKILDDDELINKLSNTKDESNRIKKDYETARERELDIRKERKKYFNLSTRATVIFFTLTDMANLDNMYQYSLIWFKELYHKATLEAPHHNVDTKRAELLWKTFLLKFYQEVCRTLFEKDKLLFAFNLTLKLLLLSGTIDPSHLRYFLLGSTEESKVAVITGPSWIDWLNWSRIYKMMVGIDKLPRFEGLREQFIEHIGKFKKIYQNDDPRTVPFPGEFHEKLDSFQKILVYKILRPDILIQCIRSFIKENLGKEFTEPPLFNLEECFNYSSKETPVVFITTPGSDPMTELGRFADKMGKDIRQIQMGQGESRSQFDTLFKRFSEDGTWLLLQNTHLFPEWLSELERRVELLKQPDIHPEFRMFLTTASSKEFPATVLKGSVKMTVETSGDAKQMMLNAYQNYSDMWVENCGNPVALKQLLFGLVLFHSLLIDRKKFGPIGWNNQFSQDFSNEDLKVTVDQLQFMLDETDRVEFKVLRFNAAVINYGGRVTDDKDDRLIRTFAKRFICEAMLEEETYQFDTGKRQALPGPDATMHEHMAHINSVFDHVEADLFGLHDNVNITTNQLLLDTLLADLTLIQPRNLSTFTVKLEDVYEDKAEDLLQKIPDLFDLETLDIKFKTDQRESMNTVLTQEALRQNTLLTRIKEDLLRFKDANRGRIVMSEDLEKMGTSILNNEVPVAWTDVGVGQTSIKPLGGWVLDLDERVQRLKEWEYQGTPNCFWMSGFFYPQAFLTGLKQNYARKLTIPIDLVDFEFHFNNKQIDKKDFVSKKVDDGCQVYGLFLEGASQDFSYGHLIDSKPRELHIQLPILHLKPTDAKTTKPNTQKCPVQKTTARYGTLTTTGHSSNFVIVMDILSKVDPEKWILAGVAAFLSLKE